MIDLTPALDKSGALPLYWQLYGYIRGEIESGTVPSGTKLPSIRELSAHLNVSKNTVETAYQQLIAEGYAESRARSGLYALAVEEAPVVPAVPPSPSAKSDPAFASRRPLELPGEAPVDFDFRYGDVERDRFPMAVWKKCLVDALHEDPPGQTLGYGHPQGDEALRAELANYLFQSRGVRCDADQIFLCAGTQLTVGMLCQLLPLRGKRVAMEEPGYAGIRTAFESNGCETVPVPLDEDGLRVERLDDVDADVVYVTPSHQFPLGMVLPIQRRNRLLQWASERDALVVEDDYDSEFRYVGQPIPALKALDRHDRVVYLGTLSKSFLPAVRVGYAVLPEPLARTMRARLWEYSQPVSPFLQRALLRFMKEGHFGRHVRRMRRLYQTKHRTLIAALHRHFGDRIEIIGQKAGLHLLIDVRTNATGEALLDAALERGVRVYSPARHWSDPGDCPPTYVMLGFGGLDEHRIDEAVGRLALAWFPSYDEGNKPGC